MDPLARALDIALTRAVELASELDDRSWQLPSPLPGWTVGDVVAHLAHLEGLTNGFDQPEPPPSEPEHPDPLHRFTESGVAARRALDRHQVVAELRAATEATRGRLGTVVGEEWDRPTTTLVGPGTLRLSTQMRVGDVYVHLLDLAHALGLDPETVRHPEPEAVIVGRAVELVGWAMVKRAHLDEGTRLHLELKGPGGVTGDWAVVDGRGTRVGPGEEPDGTIVGSGLAFVLTAGGRAWPPALCELSVAGAPAERLMGRFALFG